MEQPPTAARRALGVVWGYHMTYFGAACQPVCLTGTCKHCRTHPLRWVPANLGCGQSHLGQQPVSVCMRVPVSSSNWVNGLQYVKGGSDNRSWEMCRWLTAVMIMSSPLPLPWSRIFCVGDLGFSCVCGQEAYCLCLAIANCLLLRERHSSANSDTTLFQTNFSRSLHLNVDKHRPPKPRCWPSGKGPATRHFLFHFQSKSILLESAHLRSVSHWGHKLLVRYFPPPPRLSFLSQTDKQIICWHIGHDNSL